MQTDAVPLVRHLDASNVAASLNGSADYAFVLDAERKLRGFVTRDALGNASPGRNVSRQTGSTTAPAASCSRTL